MATASQFKVPAAARPVFDEITALTTVFCHEHLDDEYAALCTKLAAKLARKRPSPLLRGNRQIWAAAIVYTIGRVNFQADPARRTYPRTDELADLLAVKQTTMTSKGRIIMDTLGIGPANTEYCRADVLAAHPMAWLVSINGYILDARGLPEHLQAECVQRGLIPYMPPAS